MNSRPIGFDVSNGRGYFYKFDMQTNENWFKYVLVFIRLEQFMRERKEELDRRRRRQEEDEEGNFLDDSISTLA